MADPVRRSVLIVDDDPILREVLRLSLRSGGHEVVAEARDGGQALELLRRRRVELMFLDIVLPDMDGMQVLEAVRETHPQMQVIMVSSEATRSRIQEAQDKGAVGFVVKPFNAKAVLEAVDRVFPPRAPGEA